MVGTLPDLSRLKSPPPALAAIFAGSDDMVAATDGRVPPGKKPDNAASECEYAIDGGGSRSRGYAAVRWRVDGEGVRGKRPRSIKKDSGMT
jgi:hypothetical protein